MASITRRGDSWQARIKKKGYPRTVKTFKTQAAAKAWSYRTEVAMENGTWIDTRESRSVFIEEIINEYIRSYERFGIEVPIPKLTQLKQIQDFFKQVSIHDMTLDMVLDFAAQRRKSVTASTLQTQMYYFKQAVESSRIRTEQHTVDIAITELKRKKIIMGSKRRDRRLEPGEYERLMEAGEGHWIVAAIDIALESAMRQGEIHALKWADINYERKIITLWRKDKHAEKGQSKQKIPFLKGVREALTRHSNVLGQRGNLFRVARAASISDRFALLTKKVSISDLRFHDLRHEAISRMFERGMRVEQVRVVSGHRTLDQLSRYVNLRAEDIV